MPDGVTKQLELDPSRVGALHLPNDTKEFLIQKGLPGTSALLITFCASEGTFPTLDEYCRTRGLPQVDRGKEFYRIGTDDGTQICLTHGNGQVIAIDTSGRQRFVNTNIASFLRCLDTYRGYASNVQSMSEGRATALAEQTIVTLQEADPAAFSSSDNWWRAVAEQMEFGLL